MSWTVRRLSEICEINLGKTPSRSNKLYWDDEKISSNIWISIADLTKLDSRYISDSNEYISDKGASLFRPVKAGTLLMSFKLSIGKLAYAGCDLYTNEAIVALPIKNKNEINPNFLYYYLQSYDWDKETENDIKLKGKTLNKAKLNEIKVPVPTLSTQQKIVEKLDAIFAEMDKATAATEANIKNAEALFQSYLTQVFEEGGEGWVQKSIEEITLKTKNISPEKTPDKKFMYVDVSSVSNHSFEIINSQSIFGKDAPSRAKKHILKNDVIFATVRPTLKRIAVVPDFLDNQVASTGYVVLRADEKNYSRFIYFFLFSNAFMGAMNELQKGASYPAVTDNDVKLQRLKVPDLAEQIVISNKLEILMGQTFSMAKAYQSKLAEFSILKQSILNQAFNGQLIGE